MKEYVRATGFAPCFDGESKLLILGSFPSVKSRQEGFYYGNRQNRFWKCLSGYFREELPLTVEEKKAFLSRHKIALWDVITECDIVGSSDVSIRNESVADVEGLLRETGIEKIFCNGNKAYDLFARYFPQYLPFTQKLSSTSPANPRFSYGEWEEALSLALFADERK